VSRQESSQSFSTVPLERRLVELTILYEVGRALQATLDEEKALYTILVGVTAGRGLAFNRAFILLVDPEQERLRGEIAIGPSSPEEAAAIWHELREKHQTLGDLLRAVDRSTVRKDLRVNEIVAQISIPLQASAHPLIRIMQSHEASLAQGGVFQPHGLPVDESLAQLLGANAFAVAPLYLADENLGLLLADNAITGAPIDPPRLKMLQIYAQEASASLENTRLYRELMNRIEACENANRVLRESQYFQLQAERLSTIGRMAATLAHEIRTPLVSIGGFARRLLRSTAADDPRREEMQIIVAEVSRLERLVEEVLGYSKISKPECSLTDINDLILSVLLTMQTEFERASVRLVHELDPGLPKASVDQAQLRQALMNLIANSLEAMPSGGTLTVSTTFETDFLEIGISDTGIGIAEENWHRVFTPFFTTKASGTGLGLPVVSQIIDNHNGSLRFESSRGRGTSFHVRLAFDPGRHVATADPPSIAPSQEQNS